MRRFSLLWMALLILLLLFYEGARAAASSPLKMVAGAPPAGLQSDIRFKSLSVGDGLSQSTVHTLLQDRQGFLWLGTEDGLNRYDGYQFKIYRPVPNKAGSLSDRWISYLYEDKAGFIWVGTRLGGLNKYDPRGDTFTQYRHNAEDPASLVSDSVRCLLEDRDGNIWVGTYDGLDRLDPQTGAVRHYRNGADDPNSLSGNNISALFLDQKGTLWVGTGNSGLNQFDPAAGTFRHYRSEPNLETSLAGNGIAALQQAANGDLWVAAGGGVSRLDPETGQVRRYAQSPAAGQSPPKISSIYVDRGGVLWAGSDQGLNRLDEQTGQFTNYHHIPALADSLDNNVVTSIYEDREGLLWIGTYGGGVNKYNRAQDKFRYYRHNPEDANSLVSDIIFGFQIDPGGVTWVATIEGLDRFDPLTGQFSHFRHDSGDPGSLSDNFVWSVYRDRQGKLWVGTRNGLNLLDETTGKFRAYLHDSQNPDSLADSVVYAIHEDGSGALWLATGVGLDRYDRESGKFIHYVDPNAPADSMKDTVTSIREDRSGNLWVGTFNSGLFRLDAPRQKFTYYQNNPKKANSLSSNTVLALTLAQDGSLWVATGNGLDQYDPASDAFKVYTEQDGLSNNVVYAVLEDAIGRLWLSTNFGVSRFDPKAKTYRNYTVMDGLQGNEFNQGGYAQGPDGAMYLGGINGFNIFYPDQVVDNPYLAPVALTALTVNGSPIQSATAIAALDEITLEWPQDSFEFDFTALSFAEPHNNQFAYKLDHFDSEWNQIGNKRNGRYTNLPGGSYTLLLKAANSDGVWNESGKAVRVVVVAPFWKTAWFYALLGLLALGGAVLIYRLRVRTIVTQKDQLERLVGERAHKIEQLYEQNKELAVMEERNRLARELHDSAKQKAFASLAQLGAASGLINHDPASAKKHLGEAENLVYEVIQELTFLIQEMYPVALMEKGLANAVVEYVFEWETRTDIRVNLKIEGEGRLPLKAEQAVFRIVQESLANIARHSHATRVEFAMTYLPDRLEVQICDNGQGFDLEQKPNGIGLRSMHERARSVGGTLDIRSIPEQGSQVTVNVPIQLDGGKNG